MILNLHATVHADRLQYSSYPVPYPRYAALAGITSADIELCRRGYQHATPLDMFAPVTADGCRLGLK